MGAAVVSLWGYDLWGGIIKKTTEERRGGGARGEGVAGRRISKLSLISSNGHSIYHIYHLYTLNYLLLAKR